MAASTKAGAAKSPASGKRKGNVFHQRLASLTYYQACQLLGDSGADLMRQGEREFEIDCDRDVFLGGDLFRVRLPDANLPDGLAIATFTRQSGRSKQLQPNCDHCEGPCLHQAAALAYLLDAKSVLGLAAPPDESVPLEHLTHDELHSRALAERQKRAAEERMTVRSTDTSRPWTDYILTSEASGKTYRVALRGREAGQSYCSCPDFRTNHLGTCKHVLHVQAKIEKRFSAAQLRSPYQRKNISLRLHYANPLGVRFNMPYKPDAKIEEIVGPSAEQSITDAAEAMQRISALEHAGRDVHVYPDAEDFLQSQLTQVRLKKECDAISQNAHNHPLRKELLNATLLPYQLEGIAFSVGAGRAVLADDMGLGKTIQGIGVAELLAKLADISRVLIVCPASLKGQWRSEINRFSGRSTQLVLGRGDERSEQYRGDAFFTICNYEQVLRDLTAIEATPWDLIILDEGQRIKNWESKTSNIIRSLESTYRLVLSGTPLENRLGDLSPWFDSSTNNGWGRPTSFSINIMRWTNEVKRSATGGWTNFVKPSGQFCCAVNAMKSPRTCPTGRMKSCALRRPPNNWKFTTAKWPWWRESRPRNSSPKWTCSVCGNVCKRRAWPATALFWSTRKSPNTAPNWSGWANCWKV